MSERSGPTHYQALGVRVDASTAQIRAAYLRLAREHHPDAGGSEEGMRALNDAWAVLADTRQRRAYDLKIGVAAVGDSADFAPSMPASGFTPNPDVDFDNRALHDRRATHPLLLVAPVVLFGASVVVGLSGMLMTSGGLLGLGIVLFGASAALMVLVPLLQMTGGRSRRSR